MSITKSAVSLFLLSLVLPVTAAEPQHHRVKDLKITLLSTMMTQVGIGEWGFSALIEADGHRILFDTGLRPDTVLLNASRMKIVFETRSGPWST